MGKMDPVVTLEVPGPSLSGNNNCGDSEVCSSIPPLLFMSQTFYLLCHYTRTHPQKSFISAYIHVSTLLRSSCFKIKKKKKILDSFLNYLKSFYTFKI